MERLVDEYGTSMLRMCTMYLGDVHLAQDAVQDSFVKIYRAFKPIEEKTAEKAWVMRITVNVSKDYLRSSWKRRVNLVEEYPQLPAEQSPSREEGRLIQEIRTLKPKYREVILLHYYQQLKVNEIAEVLGAINDGQSAFAFISLQDTFGQGRISDTVQLMDCKISGSGVFTNDTIVNYDPQTETAVLRLEGIASNVKSQKITVSVGSLLSGETTIENQPTGYTVGELMEIDEETRAFAPTEDQVRQHSMTANDEEMMNEMGEMMDNGKIPLLQPWEKPVKINGVDWAEITAATQIGNQVHVRYATGTVLGGISTLNFSLKDENGTVLELPTVEMNIGEPKQVSETIHYTDSNEYGLMLPQDQQAKNMELLYSGGGYEQFTQGKWSTTFKLEQVKEKLSAKVDLQMDD